MHHFVIAPSQIDGDAVRFSPAQSHQIARVLRLRDGDEAVALDGRGAQYVVRLRIAGATVVGDVVGPADACREPDRRVTLLAAPPRGERWEWLLQKCTEVGVARFVPVLIRYVQAGAATVKPRHREIVREATEQCRRLLMPEIAASRPLEQALCEATQTPGAMTVLLWEGAPDVGLCEALRPAVARGVREIFLVIGPEGGFHPDEVTLARECGAAVAGLGPLILRAETAAVVAAALALNQ